MNQKRLLTIQDISCVGQCSLTVALPILSAMGIETAILPSAVLSTHTGGFKNFTFRDLTDDLPGIKNHWKEQGIRFGAFYTGYVGSARQLDYILDIVNETGTEGAKLIVDPVMGDHGRLYVGFDNCFVERMKQFCAKADVILPNITECAFMLGEEYRQTGHTMEYVEHVIEGLRKIGAKNIVMTGVEMNDREQGVAVYNDETGKISTYFREKVPGVYHGTGDIYSSVFSGAYFLGKSLEESARIAVDFTVSAIKTTEGDNAHWYGVRFEKVLGELTYLAKE
ncbi:MAG: pyridoxamine kinase [Paludibacteraceae bacterium]|nr:pyridoxamine kinase [Paludibacteraceae bacterium]